MRPAASTLSLPLPPAAVPVGESWRYVALGVAFSLIWSSAFIAGKVGLQFCGPLTLLSLRFLSAGAVIALGWRWLMPGASLRQGWDDWRAVGLAVLAGVLINGLYLGLAYHAMAHLSAGLTSILVSTSPLLTAALAWWWLGERFGWRGALGLVGALGGVMWIMAGRSAGDSSLLGIVMVLAGACCLAVATLLNRRLSGRLDPWRIALLQLCSAGLVLLPLAWWREGLQVVPTASWLGSLLYQVFISSIVTTLLLLWLIRHGGAARASSFHLLNPFFGTVLGMVLLGETVPLGDLLGAVPIVAGLALVLRPVRKAA